MKLVRKSGLLFTALYLKQCSVALQQFYGRDHKPDFQYPVSISLTRAGLPRIIPPLHRKVIKRRDCRSDYLVRLYLSWFTLAKIIECAPRISRNTFKSITSVHRDEQSFQEVMSAMKSITTMVKTHYLKKVKDLPLSLGISFVPTWKAIPSIEDISLSTSRENSSIFNLFKFEMASFGRDIRYIHSIQDGIFSPGILWRKTMLWPFHYSWNTAECDNSLQFYDTKMGHLIDQSTSCFDGYYLYPGRLAQVLDGSGKRRIFAIGNYVRQRLLRPVHDWAMEALSSLPTDGTYHQQAPLERLVTMIDEKTEVYSFDLKSATDRWPLCIIFQSVSALFGPTFASSAVNATLGKNTFDIRSFLKKIKGYSERKPVHVSFTTGQPLGYLSSWPLFSLSHHWIVWVAANLVDSTKHRVFSKYALLGDDIVIADKAVAISYQALLAKLGVSISPHKSLISDNGSFEFAKRFWVNGCKDLSPVSAKAVLNVRSSLGLIQLADRYNITNLATLFRLSGAGYRVRARMLSTKTRAPKWDRLFVMATKPLAKSQLPLEWWLGRGKPLNPYLKGIIVELLRKELRPKELK